MLWTILSFLLFIYLLTYVPLFCDNVSFYCHFDQFNASLKDRKKENVFSQTFHVEYPHLFIYLLTLYLC